MQPNKNLRKFGIYTTRDLDEAAKNVKPHEAGADPEGAQYIIVTRETSRSGIQHSPFFWKADTLGDAVAFLHHRGERADYFWMTRENRRFGWLFKAMREDAWIIPVDDLIDLDEGRFCLCTD